MVLAPNLLGLRRYSPTCPRHMHGIPPMLLGKSEANSVLTGEHFPIRTTKLHLISLTGAHWKMYTSKLHMTLC